MEKNNFYPILGNIYKKNDAAQVTDTFKKREFVLEIISEYNGKTYTELVTFELVQDACDKLDYVELGEPVEVMFALRGREYDRKDKATGQPTGEKAYFNSVKAVSITSKKEATPMTENQSANAVVQNVTNEVFDANDTGLPF